jgi:hexosaminidase
MTLLLPTPRHLHLTGETLSLPESGLIVIDAPDALRSNISQSLYFVARQIQVTFDQYAGVQWEIVSGKSVPADQLRLALMVVPGSIGHPQGYSLTITPVRIDIVAEQPVGIFYAIQTLRQLLEQHGAALPALRCRDWPDFPNRGVMLDISRNRVPTMQTLYELVDLFASWKINQLQLYTEHTFAFRNHPQVWALASPMTGEQILSLDTYCRERFIELVPNQNTFGHLTPWLIHAPYHSLAEAPDGCDTRWGHFDHPFSLNPGDPGSLDLVRSMLDELLPHFSSLQVNVGCDETVDLGMGASKQRVEELGVGRVYFEFLMKIYHEVKTRGRTMQYWGDIIMEHPQLTPELPRDAVALEWGYEADHSFDEHGALFAQSGIPFYVCPGTSSWNTIAGRSDNAIGNLRNAAVNGLKHGAVGYLITDWGDNGHWQPLPVSYLGFAYGAALAWAEAANRTMDLPHALDLHVFRDDSGVMGRLAYDLGNVHQETGLLFHNSTSLFNILQASPEQIRQYLSLEASSHEVVRKFQHTLERLDQIMAPLSQATMQRSDASLVQREFAWAAEMLRHACRRLFWALGDTQVSAAALAKDAERLTGEFTELWHARCRPGGFDKSVALLEKMRSQY